MPQAHLSSCPDKEKGSQERLVEPLMSLVKSYEGGRESHARVIVQALFEEYLAVEELFSDNIQVHFHVNDRFIFNSTSDNLSCLPTKHPFISFRLVFSRLM